MWLIDRLAEARIAEAIERGELDNLPGAGRPLNLGEDALVAESLRPAYRLLKNAGYLPRELEIRKEIHRIEELLTCVEDEAQRRPVILRLAHLTTLLATPGRTSRNLRVDDAYYERIVAKLARRASE
jgi:hypothetical protein